MRESACNVQQQSLFHHKRALLQYKIGICLKAEEEDYSSKAYSCKSHCIQSLLGWFFYTNSATILDVLVKKEQDVTADMLGLILPEALLVKRRK